MTPLELRRRGGDRLAAGLRHRRRHIVVVVVGVDVASIALSAQHLNVRERMSEDEKFQIF